MTSLLHHEQQPLRRREVYTHWSQERVRFSDTDMVGHVNNLAFTAFLETGRSLFLRDFTLGKHAPRALFLLAEVSVRFLAEAHWPDEVAIGTAVVDVGRSSIRVGQGLFTGERCFGTAESVLVLLDEATRRSREIPGDVKAWLERYRLDAGRADL
jgi:acyl-CoA thioester hydrolase